ncbi:YihY/virulence factor BrkB family protein [Adhaeribacter swui]|uniref:YihY/virulence factor BrkB family protein n=1 Tax=Adhaeribacter swui TaxID=2086471 RepID=A0A7G7G5Y3_9BACT|nr:YihY/virulence factor BrkB family protein [Adhaeribacter swui]QNF32567.1 YihY/virulence factor BrkB family protein [Adhaeribacter swui]
MQLRQKLKVVQFLLKDAFREFRKNDPLRLGASTAFFTTFALPPILVLLINFLGLLYSSEIISNRLIDQVQSLLGYRGGSGQLSKVLDNIQHIPPNGYYATLGMLFLIFVATTLFIVVKSSLNQLWNIRPRKSSTLRHIFKTRLIALGLIIFTGVLFVVTLMAESAFSYLGGTLFEALPGRGLEVIRVGNALVSYAIVTAWFAITFKYLPDIRIPWRPVWVGAFFTSMLFTFGKLVLGRLLLHSNLGPIYGPSAFVLILMLFVFYSAMLMFYGASFTKSYAHYAAFKIRPKAFVLRYRPRGQKVPITPKYAAKQNQGTIF